MNCRIKFSKLIFSDFPRDEALLSEDGYAQIVGRIKDLIIRGGENISPKEVEDLLQAHPDIFEAQVSLHFY